MRKAFKIPKDPCREGDILYKKSSITIEPGLTVLVGCNGCGKTTSQEKKIVSMFEMVSISSLLTTKNTEILS